MSVKLRRIPVVALLLSGLWLGACKQTDPRIPPPEGSYRVETLEFSQGGASQQVRGAYVTPLFFDATREYPVLGRLFLREEFQAGQQQKMILSYRFWQQQLGGDPQLIGSEVKLGGRTFIIVGVMPRSFDVPAGVDLWIPQVASGK